MLSQVKELLNRKKPLKRNPFKWILRENFRLFFAVTLFIWCWSVIYCLIGYDPTYVSRSLVMIKDSAITGRYVIPDQNYALQTTSSSSASPVLNTMGLLRAESISRKLWQYFKREHPEELKRLGIKTRTDWNTFYGNGKSLIKAKNELGTDLISVQFAWRDPMIARQGLEVILNAFRDASLDVNRLEQINRGKYLEDQVESLEKRLGDIRKRKSQYKSGMKIASLSREGEELAATGIDLANRLSQVEASANGKEAEYLRYQSMLGMSPEQALEASALGMNSTLGKLQDQLYSLSQTYALMKTTLTEKNPKLQEVRMQMAQVENDIKSELIRTLGKTSGKPGTLAVADSTRGSIISQMVTAQAESIRLSTESKVLQQRIDEVNQKIELLPDMEQELNTIEDEERSVSAALTTLRQREMEARIKQAEVLSNVFIIDSPQLPGRPEFPNQLQALAIGLMLGVLAGTLTIMAKSHWVSLGLLNPISDLLASNRQPAGLARIRRSSRILKKGEEPSGLAEVHEYQDVDAFLSDIFKGNEALYANREISERTKLLKQRLYRGLLSSRTARSGTYS